MLQQICPSRIIEHHFHRLPLARTQRWGPLREVNRCKLPVTYGSFLMVFYHFRHRKTLFSDLLRTRLHMLKYQVMLPITKLGRRIILGACLVTNIVIHCFFGTSAGCALTNTTTTVILHCTQTILQHSHSLPQAPDKKVDI